MCYVSTASDIIHNVSYRIFATPPDNTSHLTSHITNPNHSITSLSIYKQQGLDPTSGVVVHFYPSLLTNRYTTPLSYIIVHWHDPRSRFCLHRNHTRTHHNSSFLFAPYPSRFWSEKSFYQTLHVALIWPYRYHHPLSAPQPHTHVPQLVIHVCTVRLCIFDPTNRSIKPLT